MRPARTDTRKCAAVFGPSEAGAKLRALVGTIDLYQLRELSLVRRYKVPRQHSPELRCMAPLTDPALLAAYGSALANYKYEGYVEWMELARNWVRRELEGYTPRAVAELMYRYVASGGDIDQVRERRPEWREHEFHYDLRLDIAGRRVYVETRLLYDDLTDPDDPVIQVVSIHDA